MCGRGEIRTRGGLSSSTVFKTAALNHSATLPLNMQYAWNTTQNNFCMLFYEHYDTRTEPATRWRLCKEKKEPYHVNLPSEDTRHSKWLAPFFMAEREGFEPSVPCGTQL